MNALEQYVAADGGCWNFTGHVHRSGYGYTGQHVYAHRYFYQELVGPIPDGLVIDHLCMNKTCVNPEHLEPVTQGENIRRARAAYGPTKFCRNGHERAVAGTAPNGRCRRCNTETTRRYRARLST